MRYTVTLPDGKRTKPITGRAIVTAVKAQQLPPNATVDIDGNPVRLDVLQRMAEVPRSDRNVPRSIFVIKFFAVILIPFEFILSLLQGSGGLGLILGLIIFLVAHAACTMIELLQRIADQLEAAR